MYHRKNYDFNARLCAIADRKIAEQRLAQSFDSCTAAVIQHEEHEGIIARGIRKLANFVRKIHAHS